jgi:hypothetical protein
MKNYNDLPLTIKDKLEISVGNEIVEILNLKVNKDGRINTSWGKKSIQGLGAFILFMVEGKRNGSI